MATTLSAKESMRTIDQFISEVGAIEKRAAEALSEPGSIGGPTSHPSKDVDDHLQKAKEGARSKENAADVKKDEGAPSVENTGTDCAKCASLIDLSRFARPMAKAGGSEALPPGCAEDDELQIGTKVTPTGGDPSVETASAKAGKEDPGSSHPARTDNDELDGGKYAYDQLANMPLSKLAALMTDVGNDLCAALAVETPAPVQASAPAKIASDAQVAQQAGWELAGLFTGNFDKKAADALVQDTLAKLIKAASDDADRVAVYLENYAYAAAKIAADELPPDGGAPIPPDAGAGPGALPPQGIPGAMPPDAGGSPLDGGAPGAGGDPGAGGAPGGGGDQQAELMQLAALLEQAGITPEELEAAMQQEAGGAGDAGGAGGDPGAMAGGPAPSGAPAGPGPMDAGKTASDKTAAVKKGATREAIRDYIQELISRSRR